MSLHITFWGGVGTVTGANFLLEDQKTRILVDCGLEQGEPEAERHNTEPFPYDPKTIDFLFLTHAHMDHIGRVPKLIRDGFSGTIFSTPETHELSTLMFSDALKVMEENHRINPTLPLMYDKTHIEKALSLWKNIPYHFEQKINDSISVNVLDAGHVLGSAMYNFKWDGKSIVFTGDSGNSPSPLLKDTDMLEGVEYLIMDSVYGNKNHEPKAERDEKFKRIVKDAIKHKGNLIIPAFSLERSQVILYELNNLIEKNLVPSVPVYLDSPLAQKITSVYQKYPADFNDSVQKAIRQGDNIFNFPKLNIVHSRLDSMSLDKISGPKIIIAGSGMSNGGRVVGHESYYLPDPNTTVLLMGYQAVGTLGRQIQNVPPTVYINGKNVPLRARVENIAGYSAHKDSDHLLQMVSNTKETLKKVFVTMGEPESSLYLVQRLQDYAHVDAMYPERGKIYEI